MDITYVGKSDGDYFDLYHFLADGNRALLEILVSPDMSIWIAGVGGFGIAVPQLTKGVAHSHSIVEGIEPVVCLKSVAGYVIPRISTLMGRVYVPAPVKSDKES
jgi:hypothetical protein